MVEKVFFIGLILFAAASIFTVKLRRSIIYMSVFSLLMSFVALLYHAPDVAIAEAVIGCTLSTILYLIALKKKRICSICFVQQSNHFDDTYIHQGKKKILKVLERFLIEEGVEPQVVYSNEKLEQLLEHKNHNLILTYEDDKMILYGAVEDDLFIKTINFIKMKKKGRTFKNVEVIIYQMEGDTCSVEYLS
jgi:uncharacterized MnhB-related membrane protein